MWRGDDGVCGQISIYTATRIIMWRKVLSFLPRRVSVKQISISVLISSGYLEIKSDVYEWILD